MVKQTSCREATKVSGVATVDVARRIARRVVERQKGLCGGKLDTAFFQCSALLGITEGTLRMLYQPSRILKSVTAEIYLRLVQFDEALKEIAAAERAAATSVADDLERRGHPAARMARLLASMADEVK
jgi:hypothetical protein